METTLSPEARRSRQRFIKGFNERYHEAYRAEATCGWRPPEGLPPRPWGSDWCYALELDPEDDSVKIAWSNGAVTFAAWSYDSLPRAVVALLVWHGQGFQGEPLGWFRAYPPRYRHRDAEGLVVQNPEKFPHV